ncbi:MAG: dihydrodipicolinate synthase family protein [Lentisphaeria bacterium]|nr:dihydrodipicolinate synthase family protein [Lentisphaeria bacterium]
MFEKIRGLIAAPFTPFKKDGSVNYEVIPLQAESLIRQGISGAYVSGTTGEGVSCSVAERIQIMDAWKEAAGDRLKLIIHTGALSIADIRELGRHAQKLGVFGTSIVPPTYFKPTSISQLTEFCRLAAAAAPELPFYYYHTMLTAPNLPMVDFLKAADGVIPNLAGIKFNCHNLYEFQNCRRLFNGKYDIVFGVDEFFAGALALGTEGFIGSTYNYGAKLYLRVWDEFRKGDWSAVRSDMDKVCAGVDLLVQYGGLAAGKAIMGIQGIECGDPRPPLTPLNREIIEKIRTAASVIYA